MCLVIKVDIIAGTSITCAVEAAIRLAIQTSCSVEFKFNGARIFIPSHSEFSDMYEIVDKYENGYYDRM